MRWISRSILPAAVALAALVSFFPSAGPKIELHMRDFKFVPASLTIKAGDSIALVNDGRATHSFQCVAQGAQRQRPGPDCGAHPGDVQPGLSKVVKFTRAGQYDFFCRYHASRAMAGRLIVLGPGGQAPAPAPSPPPATP